MPEAEALIGDRGYDADWLRKAAEDMGMKFCIKSKKNRSVQKTMAMGQFATVAEVNPDPSSGDRSS